jgi:hypothetical protein
MKQFLKRLAQRFEGSMAAVTFAEAGEAATARRLLAEVPTDPAPATPKEVAAPTQSQARHPLVALSPPESA